MTAMMEGEGGGPVDALLCNARRSILRFFFFFFLQILGGDSFLSFGSNAMK